MIKFMADVPACFIPDIKSVLISDVHIGIEYELYKSGIVIPSQVEKFTSIIRKLVEETQAQRIIILGDLKYKVPGISIKELKDIPKLLNNIKSFTNVIICKGNHDDNLETVLPEDIKLHGSGGFKIKKYGFFHGHAWPNKKLMGCDHLFMGHIQPAIELKDSLGFRLVEQVWIKTKLNAEIIRRKYKLDKTGSLNLVVLPAFNRLSGSLILNSDVKKSLTGPLFSSSALDENEFKLFLLDGSYVGNLPDLKKHRSFTES